MQHAAIDAEGAQLVREQAAISIENFKAAEMWIQLKVPACSDGNNFGVSIVMEAKKMVADEKKALAVRAHRASPGPLRRAWRDI